MDCYHFITVLVQLVQLARFLYCENVIPLSSCTRMSTYLFSSDCRFFHTLEENMCSDQTKVGCSAEKPHLRIVVIPWMVVVCVCVLNIVNASLLFVNGVLAQFSF